MEELQWYLGAFSTWTTEISVAQISESAKSNVKRVCKKTETASKAKGNLQDHLIISVAPTSNQACSNTNNQQYQHKFAFVLQPSSWREKALR